jgi:hypothetical protein
VSPQEAQIRYNVAWLLARKGERASARRHAEIAASLSPGDANVQRLLERLSE